MMIHSLKRGESKRELTKKEKEFVSAGKKFRKLAKKIKWEDGALAWIEHARLHTAFVRNAWELFEEMK